MSKGEERDRERVRKEGKGEEDDGGEVICYLRGRM